MLDSIGAASQAYFDSGPVQLVCKCVARRLGHAVANDTQVSPTRSGNFDGGCSNMVNAFHRQPCYQYG